jgi:putative methyltransferase (TIGR04325 family)
MLREYSRSFFKSEWASRMLVQAEHHSLSNAALRRLSFPRVAFDTFEDAWRAAASDRHAGHDTDSIPMHWGMRHQMRASDPAVLNWLHEVAGHGSLRLLDFGGNVGNLYYCYRPHLPQALRLEWQVIDLPAVVEAGRRLAETEESNGELHFATSLSGLPRNFDVVLASGSLHYWESSITSWLRALPGIPAHIIVNRSPIHKSHPTFITVQQRETFAVPCIVRNRSEMLSDFWKQGYKLIDEWEAPELSLTFTFFPALSVPRYSGFCFRKDSPPQTH